MVQLKDWCNIRTRPLYCKKVIIRMNNFPSVFRKLIKGVRRRKPASKSSSPITIIIHFFTAESPRIVLVVGHDTVPVT